MNPCFPPPIPPQEVGEVRALRDLRNELGVLRQDLEEGLNVRGGGESLTKGDISKTIV